MPTLNQELQTLFEQLADGLELSGDSGFRVSSHRRVARVLGGLTTPVDLIAGEERSAARLQEIDGIGKGAARRILEFLDTGEVADHQKVLAKVPQGLFRVLQIPGLGPKAVRAIWQHAEVESLDDLRLALDDGRLADVPRMGQKTIDNLRQAIDFAAKTQDRLPIGQAKPLADTICRTLLDVDDRPDCDLQVAYAGSLRRGRETVGDLDFVAASADSEVLQRVASTFVGQSEVERVLVEGETKCSVWLRTGQREIQADLRLVTPDVFGATMMYFTGSKEHNVRLRQIAIDQDKRLNEYGLFAGSEPRPQDDGVEPLQSLEEQAIYGELGLEWIPPELREETFEPAKLEASGIAELVTVESIQADLHAHTTASDGRHSIEEMVDLALDRGLKILALTDHSRSSALAGGLDIDDLLEHAAAIRAAAARARERGLLLLAGSEVDILADGSLDYPDEVLAQLDLVVASPHAALNQDSKTATARLVKALGNPHVDVLGHPTGRQVGRRRGLEPDMSQVFAAAAHNQTALEINANPRRLDLRDDHVRGALETGCLISINTDTHSARHFDHLPYGVATGRRAGLTVESCVNSWDAERLQAWLSERRPT